MYDDSGSSWGHRHLFLWYPLNDNSGPAGKEGLVGIGKAIGGFQGYSNSDIIVMDLFDPRSTWDYSAGIVVGLLNGNGSLGLEDAILVFRVLSQSGLDVTVHLDREADKDGKIGLPDALFILQFLAGLRGEGCTCPRPRLSNSQSGGTNMDRAIKAAIIGDYNPDLRFHKATNEALKHAAKALSLAVDFKWLPTQSLDDKSEWKNLERFDALWGSPGSPYNSMDGALQAIRFAREMGWPFIGT